MADFDVIVIGGGPAGYVAAIRCAQLGLKTALVERWLNKTGQPALGGTCLNVGCIPSKALLESSEIFETLDKQGKQHGIKATSLEPDVPQMIKRKDQVVAELTGGIAGLIKANGIEWLRGQGLLRPGRVVDLTDLKGKQSNHSAEHVILATGSRPIELPAAPLAGERIVDSSGALDWESVPKSVCVIGAGVIGLELGSVWRRLGAKVTTLEALDTFLPAVDGQIAREALRQFQQQGLDIRLGARMTATKLNKSSISIDYTDAAGAHKLRVERLIVAVGRTPNSESLAAPEVELLLDERGFVHVDEQCETNIPGVYAIGDLVRGPMLAHKGSEEGAAVAQRIAGQDFHVNYACIPNVIYTHPEISWVGKTEEEVKAEATDYSIGLFPFAASGRAKAMEDSVGLVKVITCATTDKILGVHIIGPHSSEIIGQGVMAMEFDATSEDLAQIVFAHPTLSEALHEAALGAEGRAIHIPNRKR
ncbi:MAG: dihydrolipoyl dehydrogenase [Cellvibrionales bacterium]|nr:dihydrolipoyl dehydrogenase [Cellvibrionales bacterium]